MSVPYINRVPGTPFGRAVTDIPAVYLRYLRVPGVSIVSTRLMPRR